MAGPWSTRRRQRRIAALKQLAASASDDRVVVYADEVDIHLNPVIGPDWMLPGTQRLVLTPGKNLETPPRRRLRTAEPPARLVEGDAKASWLFRNRLRALLQACDRTQRGVLLVA